MTKSLANDPRYGPTVRFMATAYVAVVTLAATTLAMVLFALCAKGLLSLVGPS